MIWPNFQVKSVTHVNLNCQYGVIFMQLDSNFKNIISIIEQNHSKIGVVFLRNLCIQILRLGPITRYEHNFFAFVFCSTQISTNYS